MERRVGRAHLCTAAPCRGRRPRGGFAAGASRPRPTWRRCWSVRAARCVWRHPFVWFRPRRRRNSGGGKGGCWRLGCWTQLATGRHRGRHLCAAGGLLALPTDQKEAGDRYGAKTGRRLRNPFVSGRRALVHAKGGSQRRQSTAEKPPLARALQGCAKADIMPRLPALLTALRRTSTRNRLRAVCCCEHTGTQGSYSMKTKPGGRAREPTSAGHPRRAQSIR